MSARASMREISLDELPGLLRQEEHGQLADLIEQSRTNGPVLAGVLLGAHAALTDLDEPGEQPDPLTEAVGAMGRAIRAGLDQSNRVVSISEIAERFNVAKSTVHLWTAHEHWPREVAELATGRVWRLADIEAWTREHRRAPGRPPKR